MGKRASDENVVIEVIKDGSAIAVIAFVAGFITACWLNDYLRTGSL